MKATTITGLRYNLSNNCYVTTLVITSHRHKTRPISHLSTSSRERPPTVHSGLPRCHCHPTATADVPVPRSTANTILRQTCLQTFGFLPEKELVQSHMPSMHMPHLSRKMTSHERIYVCPRSRQKQLYIKHAKYTHKLSASRPGCGRNLTAAPGFSPRDARDASNWQYYNTYHSIHDQRS